MFRTRRDALKLLAAAPFLAPAFGEVLGAPGDPIKRAVMIMLHTGVASEYWFPVGAAKAAMDFTGTSLASLTPLKHKISIIQDLTVTMGRGDNHATAPRACLAAQLDSNIGVSLDQHIVNKVKPTTPRRNITMALCKTFTNQPAVFFKAKGSRADLLYSPYVAINDLFGSFVPGAPSPTTPVNDLALRKSMLDALNGDLSRMSKRLAGPEKEKLEAHLSLVRGSELRIGQNMMRPADNSACSKLTSPAALLEFNNINNLIPLGKVYMDLIAMAMACDVCRIFGLEVTQSNPNNSFTWPGISVDSKPVPDGAQGLHRLAHASAGTNDRILFGKVNATYASLYAYLLTALDGIKEGSRTLLDNSVVMLGNAYGDAPSHDGKDHGWTNTPYVIGGGGGGFYKSGGQIIAARGKSHTQVLGSVLEYFQVDRSPAPSALGDGEFGAAGYSYETLPGLKA